MFNVRNCFLTFSFLVLFIYSNKCIMSLFRTNRRSKRSQSTLAPPTALRRSCSNPESHPSPRARHRYSVPLRMKQPQQHHQPTNQEFQSFYGHLVRIALDPHTKSPSSRRQLVSMLHCQLIFGWNISVHLDTTYFRLKSQSLTIPHTLIVFDNISDVLQFSFSKFLDLSQRPSSSDYPSKLRWVHHCYRLLIESLSLEQRAVLFSKCAPTKHSKYSLVHHHKDCVIGKLAVDFLVKFQFCSNRKSAVKLGQQFMENGWLLSEYPIPVLFPL